MSSTHTQETGKRIQVPFCGGEVEGLSVVGVGGFWG